MNKTYVKHSGIKGMKWGLRRFQYEDGTLTPLGKQRYGTPAEMYKDINKVYGSVDNVKNMQEHNRDNLGRNSKVLEGTSKVLKDAALLGANPKKSKIVNGKDYSQLTDDDLRKKINRITMEKSYGELTGDTKKIRTGEDWTREILQTVGAVVGIASGVAGIALAMVDVKNKKKNGGK